MKPLRALAFASILAFACTGPVGTGSAGSSQHLLHIAVAGQGAVRSAAIGADCDIDCKGSLTAGQGGPPPAGGPQGGHPRGRGGAPPGASPRGFDARPARRRPGDTTPPPRRPAPPPPAGPRYSVVPLSQVVGGGWQPVAMNAGGQVIGNGPGGPWIYDASNGSVRKVLPSYETRTFVANGISASGDVALDLVGKDTAGGPTHHAFRLSQGKLVDLGTLGGAYSTAKVINSAGVVAGDATLAG